MMLDMTHLAARQLRDCDARTPGTMFAKQLSFSEEQAYALQSTICRLREQRGALVTGYKIGCTLPGIQQRLGADHPVFGRLFVSERWPSGMDLPSRRFAGLAIESELAVRLVCVASQAPRCATCPGVMKTMASPCRTNFHETRKSGRSAPAGMTTLRLSRSISQAQGKSGRAQSVVLQDSTLRTSLPGETGDLYKYTANPFPGNENPAE